MQVSSLLIATLALVAAAPIPPATMQEMTGYQGAITNARQVQDTLNRQLQANNGAHANQAAINAFITGADSQIDNAIATVSEALAPYTLGASEAVGQFLLGPFVQSVTNGAEVSLANLIGGGADLVDAQMAAALTGNYSKLAAFASKNNVDASKLQHSNEQISKTLPYSKAKRDEGGMDGIKGAITNMKQTIDTMKFDMENNKGHGAQDAVTAFITGADSQIDNLAATLANGLNGVTLGISGKIGDFLLGPFVQSVTNGAEVVVSNVIGGSIDIVTDGTSKLFSNALSDLHKLSVEHNVNENDTKALADAQKKVKESKAPKKSKSKSKRDEGGMDGIKGAITNMKQTIDTMKFDMENNKGHGAQDAVTAFITGADSQIDNLAATLANGLNGVTLGISGKIGDFLLGPFVQSVTNGAEVVVSNVIGGSIDIVTDGTSKSFSNALSDLHKLAVEHDVNENDTKALADAQKKVKELKAPKKSKSKSKRSSAADMEGVNGAMTNHKQVMDTSNEQLQSHNGHAAQAVINAFITGADSQIDNAIATVSDALSSMTLGVSKAIGDVLLGPFVQSVTNGAEVLISNLIGGGIDMAADSSVEMYNNALSRLTQAATKFGIKTDNLQKAQSELAKYLPKSH